MKIEKPLLEDGLRLLGFVAIVSFLMFDPLGIIAAERPQRKMPASISPSSRR